MDDLTRYAVVAVLAAVLVLMAARWRVWAAAPEVWRLLGVALSVLTLSVLLGTLLGIWSDRPLGPHVGGNLTAGLIALYALIRRRDSHAKHPPGIPGPQTPAVSHETRKDYDD